MMELRSEPRFSDLTTNRQRIRYLYRQLVLRSMLAGYSYKQFLTPRETGEDLSRWGQQAQRNKQLIDLYNQARYSEKPISDEQMESVHKDPND
ncbi:MAG: hypothetical protein JWN30_325 [Bacilli bacterium]|nr:hypothetical protein [Bacilli bacterium]